jgi:hypothetical protein
MSLVLQSSGGGQITIQEPTTASNFTQDLPAATGTVVITGTTPTLNGITFPATQVPSADANTLDDYEEGTFTPLYQPETGSFSSITYQEQFGAYTKIGNRVYVQGRIRTSSLSVGSASGAVNIAGLPFTVINNSTTGRNAGCLSVVSTWGGDYPSGIYAESNTTYMTLLYRTAANGTTANLDVTDMSTGGSNNQVFFSLCYII